MLRGRPSGEIITAFRHELEREIGANAMYPGQILSKQCIERFAHVEVRSIRLSASASRGSRTICVGVLLAPPNRNEFIENRLDPDVAGGDLLLIHIIERQRLLQDKQMLCPITVSYTHLHAGMLGSDISTRNWIVHFYSREYVLMAGRLSGR